MSCNLLLLNLGVVVDKARVKRVHTRPLGVRHHKVLLMYRALNVEPAGVAIAGAHCTLSYVGQCGKEDPSYHQELL